MRIDYRALDPEMFKTTEQEGLVLIRPRISNREWNLGSLHLRSLVVRAEDGEIVSSGLPKFFNMGEYPAYEAQFRQCHPITAYEKIDGSLIIRSVIDGRVHVRTRGSLTIASDEDTEDYNASATRKVLMGYPAVYTDTSFGVGRSYLFECTEPTNRIVILYDRPQLWLLGYMDLSDSPPSFHYPDLDEAMFLGAQIPRRMEQTDLDEAAGEVQDWVDREGVVLSAPYQNSYLLLKVKCPWYLRLHSLKYGMSTRSLQQMLVQNSIESEDSLKVLFLSLGYDWEGFDFIRKSATEYFERLAEARAVAGRFIQVIERLGVHRGNPTRGEQVKIVRSADQGSKELFNLAMSYLDGRNTDDWAKARALGLSISEFKGLLS